MADEMIPLDGLPGDHDDLAYEWEASEAEDQERVELAAEAFGAAFVQAVRELGSEDDAWKMLAEIAALRPKGKPGRPHDAKQKSKPLTVSKDAERKRRQREHQKQRKLEALWAKWSVPNDTDR
jgi:hypothetical protein